MDIQPKLIHGRPVRVLVVDDEPSIRDAVMLALRYEGYELDEASTGREALSRVDSFQPDLVVLDVMMPELSGVDVLKRLRREGHETPVLFLTAVDDSKDIIESLRLGADDYVTKPFSLGEVVARIEVILKRAGSLAPTGVLVFHDLSLNEVTHEVTRNGHLIDLTATEFSLLRLLMGNPKQVFSKTQILDHVWEYDFGGDSNVVETYISYLRKKLDPFGPPLIKTIRGVGYALRAPVEADAATDSVDVSS